MLLEARLPALLLVFGVGLSAVAAQAPSPAGPLPPVSAQARPTFRAEVNYVELTVRALNGKGEFVGDLRQSDFQVLEDKRPQAITTFAFIEGSRAFAAGTVSAPPASPPAPAAGADATELKVADRQVYLFVMDDMHVRPDYSVNARRVGQWFVDAHMGAGDVAGVLFTSGAPKQDLTTDKVALRKAFDRFIGELDPAQQIPRPPLLEGLVVSKALANLSDWLAGIPGRHKAIVYVSSVLGCNVGYIDADEKSEDVNICRDAVLDAVDAATHANVSIYSIDPQGMAVGSAQNAQSHAPLAGGLGGPSPVASVRQAQVPGPIHGVRAVAEMTGGFFELGATRLDRFFQRVISENSSYYLVGYYSSNPTDVKVRTLRTNEIKIARRGVRAYYRRQYAISPDSGKNQRPN